MLVSLGTNSNGNQWAVDANMVNTVEAAGEWTIITYFSRNERGESVEKSVRVHTLFPSVLGRLNSVIEREVNFLQDTFEF